jgi:ferredoxin-nitrite reductase
MINMQELRIEGIYQQRQDGYFMRRIKLPAGVLSAEQALAICAVADRFARGRVHLTTRCSMELHWLREDDLPEVLREMAAAGLTSRGACGGAVRGITCSTQAMAGFPAVERLARQLHDHFTGNPRFEGLPKKFKIAVEGGYAGGRHLIQDVGLVLARLDGEKAWYDVWAAGGLGRAPVPGFLLAEAIPDDNVIPLVERVVRVYATHTPPGKRLKHLVTEVGQESFRQLLAELPEEERPLHPVSSTREISAVAPGRRIEARPFAGEITTADLRAVTECARDYAGAMLIVTAEQNLALHLTDDADPAAAARKLVAAGFAGTTREERMTFRICPGNHECRMGLGPTRDIARAIMERLGPVAEGLAWAISGCPNSCAQPQLAEVGVVISRLEKNEAGERHPRFDLLRGGREDAFAAPVATNLAVEELLAEVERIG